MYNISLHIKLKDWAYILLIGMLFGMVMSSLGYILLQYNWLDGAFFGLILGFSITVFSLFFITYMNKYILPKIDPIYWIPLSMVFSFLSGFLGTFIGDELAQKLGIALISVLHEEIITVAIFTGVLTYIVGALLYRFVKMRNQKDKLDNAYVQSRLRSLESQLNPHFLFNSLNSIAELIHQDKDKAEMAILKVSSFLRNTMDEKALVLLADEIRNVQDYVELENIRFSGKINFVIKNSLVNWKIPKFSIQLIVENAIKHGFLSERETLNITLYCIEEKKEIVIQNDGKEMSKKSFGLGLNNLNQRLELLCHGSLMVESLKNPSFKIYLGECCENINC